MRHSVWKSQKSLIQLCERSELRLHFEWTKVVKNAKNGSFWRVSETPKLAVKQCYQTCQLYYDKNWWKTQIRHFWWSSHTVIHLQNTETFPIKRWYFSQRIDVSWGMSAAHEMFFKAHSLLRSKAHQREADK